MHHSMEISYLSQPNGIVDADISVEQEGGRYVSSKVPLAFAAAGRVGNGVFEADIYETAPAVGKKMEIPAGCTALLISDVYGGLSLIEC